MQLEEFKQAIRAKAAQGATDDPSDAGCVKAFTNVVAEAVRVRSNPTVGTAAVDPSFWLTLISTLVPILLEWINRRFPRPTPPAPPAP